MSKPETFTAPEIFPPFLQGEAFTGPLVWWNHSMTAGGVERQIYATAASLGASDGIDLELLLEDRSGEGENIFMDRVRPLFGRVSTVFEAAGAIRARSPECLRAVEEYFGGFSPFRKQLIAMYAAWFLEARPRLVQIWNAELFQVALAALLAGVPNIILCCACMSPGYNAARGLAGGNRNVYRDVLKFLLNFPAVTLTGISSANRQDHAEWLGLEQHSILYTPHAFVPELWEADAARGQSLRAESGIPEQAPVLGGMFRFAKVKDPLLWVETALAVLAAKPEAYAILAGDGDLHEDARRRVESSPQAGRFLLPGTLKEAGSLYRACDVFLHTSHSEGLGNVIMEAQYHRLPVVCTDCGGPADVIEDKKSGFIVTGREARELAAHVLYALEHKDWAARAGELGRQKVLRNFSARRAALGFKKLYTLRGCL